MVHYIIDHDTVEKVFDRAKSLSELSAQKNALLEKNKKAITDDKGNIPEKYQGAFSRLVNECKRLEKQVSSNEELLVKVAQAYVQETSMGNLIFENGKDGTEFFEDVYTQLYDENFNIISAAINALDLKKLDSVVQKMREVFISKCFDKYREYAKTLSINN